MSAPTYRGSAIPVLTLEPQWSSVVRLTLVHRSSVYEALDTSEERHGLSPRPLYRLEYDAMTSQGSETGYCRRLFDLANAVPIACPVWFDYVTLTAQASIGATTLTVDTTQNSLWQVANDYCLVRSDWRTWELLQCSSVGSTSIGLTDATTKLWSVGTRIYPVLFGRLSRNDWTALTDEHATIPITFDETFNLIGNQGRIES